MDKQAEICETYQLKWSSYNSYIHSCISTSFRNDSFADVALVTVDGHQIMAHRFVLSYSSQFLGNILRFQPKVTTALPIMIVMPPEIDYKSLKVLVRYMYSGEAKVSKDILNAVLKGGDLLQIKGLYREKEDPNKIPKLDVPQLSQKVANATTTTIASTGSNSTITSQSLTTKPNQIILNKSVPVSQSSPVQIQVPKASSPQSVAQQPASKYLVVQKPKEQKTYVNPHTKVLNFTIMNNFDKGKQKPSEPIILNKTLDQTKATDSKGESSKKKDDQVVVKTEPGHGKESNLQYLMIKNEPIEWSEADMELIDSKEIFDDMIIKSENTEQDESNSNSNEDEESIDEENMFSPLTCELCTERFTIPAEWVRHVQTHTDMLPAKRRRRDSPGDSYENDTFPELNCDMCQKSFPTPAEWVQHIQNTHTEFELHLCNKTVHRSTSTPPVVPPATETSGSCTETAKVCKDCDKTFPSHASMVIHRRRHTGEKPYDCEFCKKSFNVKSNLLRHLRTLHNKIINSTEIESKENSDNSN